MREREREVGRKRGRERKRERKTLGLSFCEVLKPLVTSFLCSNLLISQGPSCVGPSSLLLISSAIFQPSRPDKSSFTSFRKQQPQPLPKECFMTWYALS